MTKNTLPATPEKEWGYVGPDNIEKIVVGDKTYVLRQMSQAEIETLLQQFPTYKSWFKKK